MCKSLHVRCQPTVTTNNQAHGEQETGAPENLREQVTHERRNTGKAFPVGWPQNTPPPGAAPRLNSFPRKLSVWVALGTWRRKSQEDILLPALQRQPKTLFLGSRIQHYTDNKLTHIPDLGWNPHFKMKEWMNEWTKNKWMTQHSSQQAHNFLTSYHWLRAHALSSAVGLPPIPFPRVTQHAQSV